MRNYLLQRSHNREHQPYVEKSKGDKTETFFDGFTTIRSDKNLKLREKKVEKFSSDKKWVHHFPIILGFPAIHRDEGKNSERQGRQT